MIKITKFLFLLSLTCLVPTPVQGSTAEAASPEALLKQGAQEMKQGHWDISEVNFLKAAQSPEVESRIQAYEGLAQLYSKVRLEKKAARIKEKIEAEKKFKARLVPEEENYYVPYKVKKGDTYIRIAHRNEVSFEWLMRANQSKPLIEGQTIKLPKVHDAIKVDKKTKKLFWMRGDELIKTYPVAVGRKDMETPEGEFTIINKAKDPIWYTNGKQYLPESPDNLLGTRWLGFDHKGYGIHGTRNPESIGAALSHGCVRMYNRDVEELFDWIPVGTKVRIMSSEAESKRKDPV